MRVIRWLWVGVLVSGCGLVRDPDDVVLRQDVGVHDADASNNGRNNNGSNNSTNNSYSDMDMNTLGMPDLGADMAIEDQGMDVGSDTGTDMDLSDGFGRRASTTYGKVCSPNNPLNLSTCNPVDPGLGCQVPKWCGVAFQTDALVDYCVQRSPSTLTQGDPCGGTCATGFNCHLGTCKKYCELATARGCQAAESCAIMASVAHMGIGVCQPTCD